MIEFEAWPKTPRLSNSSCTITEKIDGTNACVIIQEVDTVDHWGRFAPDHGGVCYVHVPRPQAEGGGERTFLIGAQSRKRLIFPAALSDKGDNAGFAQWVYDNRKELVDLLGSGRHFGEWWGKGIQRGYNMDHKVFSLFNVHRWSQIAKQRSDWWDRALDIHMDVVPELYIGKFSDEAVQDNLQWLRENGSLASYRWGKIFTRPEGIIVRHSQLGGNLKAFVENDDIPKSLSGD